MSHEAATDRQTYRRWEQSQHFDPRKVEFWTHLQETDRNRLSTCMWKRTDRKFWPISLCDFYLCG